MEYLLLDAYPDYFFCDPDYWPISEEGGEERNSIKEFSSIRANAEEFAAILDRLALSNEHDYSAADKLAIYREHKKLTYAIQATSIQSGYGFRLHTKGQDSLCIEGSIAFDGTIRESKRETCFVECPICLTRDTVIATPAGPVPVQELVIGDVVWTLDETGQRVEAPVIETAAVPVASHFEVIEVTLTDGRIVTASPGHPTCDGRPLGSYREGEMLDRTSVASVERIRYGGTFTYDLLPAGPTGVYWANGVLLESTLAERLHTRPGPKVTSGK